MTREKRLEICKLCGIECGSLVKSHIIPKGLYGEVIKDPTGPAKLVPFELEKRPAKSQTGVYSRIVCGDCEGLFAQWDDYAIRLLRDREPEMINANGETVAFTFDDVDRNALLLFYISLLWRSEVSDHPFFTSVKLGPYEKICRTAVLERNPDAALQIDVAFAKFSDPLARAFLNPYPEKLEGINVYRFSFLQVTSIVKVDRLPFPDTFRRMSLRNSDKVTMIARQFSDSPEFKALVETVKRRASSST